MLKRIILKARVHDKIEVLLLILTNRTVYDENGLNYLIIKEVKKHLYCLVLRQFLRIFSILLSIDNFLHLLLLVVV